MMTKGFTSGMRTSLDGTWTTPSDYFDKINAEFNFTLDAAALSSSTLVPDNWYGPDHPDQSRRDALVRNWVEDSTGPIWLNPPYGRVIKDWMRKANAVANGGGTVVCQYQLVLIQLGGTTTAQMHMRLDLFVAD